MLNIIPVCVSGLLVSTVSSWLRGPGLSSCSLKLWTFGQFFDDWSPSRSSYHLLQWLEPLFCNLDHNSERIWGWGIIKKNCEKNGTKFFWSRLPPSRWHKIFFSSKKDQKTGQVGLPWNWDCLRWTMPWKYVFFRWWFCLNHCDTRSLEHYDVTLRTYLNVEAIKTFD